jgi:aerobic-type carbon monoxide dehydrogenase small subunit (CoxS/CutS family)
MTAKAMLDKDPHPTDAQIRETMNATLCRCMMALSQLPSDIVLTATTSRNISDDTSRQRTATRRRMAKPLPSNRSFADSDQ